MSAERLLDAGMVFGATDPVLRIRGIGGAEIVVAKILDTLAVGDAEYVARDFEVEVGGMDYGISMDGILGMDYLARLGLVIDLATLELRR